MATPEILSISPTRIDKKEEKEAAIFETIKETNLPLSLDSGASEHFRLKSGSPTNNRSQGNSEIVITEFKREFHRLLSSGTFQQAHPADLLTRQV